MKSSWSQVRWGKLFLASPKILKEGQAVFWFLLRLFQAGGEKFFGLHLRFFKERQEVFWVHLRLLQAGGKKFFGLHLIFFKEVARCLFGLT